MVLGRASGFYLARGGRAHEMIDELVAACERAQQQVAEIMASFSRCR